MTGNVIAKIKKVSFDILLSIIAGISLYAASPGVDYWYAAFVAVILLPLIYERRRLYFPAAAALCGFVWYLFALNWLDIPMVRFGNAPVYAGHLLVVFTSLTGALLCWVPYAFTVEKTRSYFLGGLVFVALEMVKGKYLFGGLPWLNLAQTQYNNPYLLQIVSVLGEHGLSFILLSFGYIMYKAIASKGRDIYYLKVCAAIIVFTVGTGVYLYHKPEKYSEYYTARLVQTGLEQEAKWTGEMFYQVVSTISSRLLDAAAKEGEYDIMVTPEVAYPVNPFEYSRLDGIMQAVSKKPLLIGYDRSENGATAGGIRYYNSMALVLDGRVTEYYDKMKLAPFGEYFPFENLLYPVRHFFFGDSPFFSSGVIPAVFTIGELKIAPMICFEGAFSELWRERVENGANVFVVSSNNAWFGDSIGRDQHLAVDAVHAVEYGRFLIRSTQDGISGIISPKGDMARFPEKVYHVEDVLFSPINSKTYFTQMGYTWYAVLITVFGYRLIKRRGAERKQTDVE